MRVEPLQPQHDLNLAVEMVGLQQRSYALEAELIGDTRIPPLQEEVGELQAQALTWLGVRMADQLVSAVGFTERRDLIDIDRLVVDPAYLRRGLGRLLVTSVLEHAAARAVVVSTGRDNGPARRLYEKLGFEACGDEEVLPRLWITRYRWDGR